MAETTKIDTGRVTVRRDLHFHSIDELTADAGKLAEADRQGRLKRLGNWTLGQNLNHLATWVKFSFEGAPMSIPWFVRLPMKVLAKKRFINGPMPAGSKIPRVQNGTFGGEPIELDEALANFEREFARLKSGPPSLPHMIFGPLSHEDWINTHLRHAELHLSFLRAD
jgi:hypothetical protein